MLRQRRKSDAPYLSQIGCLERLGRTLASALLVFGAVSLPLGATAFDLDDVAAKAQEIAGQPFQEPKGQVPDWLLKITYDQWRDIRFRPDRALWRDRRSPFQVHFFHPGFFYDRTVAMNVIEADGV